MLIVTTCIVLLDNRDERHLFSNREAGTLAVFTSREKARAFLDSADLQNEWHLARTDSETTIDILLRAARNGTDWVAIDPNPHFHRSVAVPLSTLVEELRSLAKESRGA